MEKTENLQSEFDNLQIKRKLASVQVIKDLTPIGENENNLELAHVLGWQVVVRKGEFKVGELVIYFEIDSKLPDDRWCEDMQFYNYRVGTVSINGVVSQGIIKHISVLKNPEQYKVGDDVTEVLDVTKYDDEETSNNIIENSEFPIHLIPFTDEPRAQSEPRYIELFKGRPFVATLKYDGTSSSYVLNPNNKDELWVCSRNKMIEPKKKNDYWTIAEKYKIKEKLQKYPEYAIQGEIYGPGIQKNLLGMKEKCLAVFNVYSLKDKKCLDYDELVDVCKILDLPVVQLIARGDSFNHTIEDCFEMVKGNYEGTENQREGIVYRWERNWYTPNLRASFKVISNDHLMLKK